MFDLELRIDIDFGFLSRMGCLLVLFAPKYWADFPTALMYVLLL